MWYCSMIFENNKYDESGDKCKIFYYLKAKRRESRNKLFILKMKKPEDEFHTHFVIIQNPTVPFQKFLSMKISLLIRPNQRHLQLNLSVARMTI